MKPLLVLSCCALAAAIPSPATAQQANAVDSVGASWNYETSDARFRVEVVANDFRVPWAMAFLPDGRALVTDRPTGRLVLLDVRTGQSTAIQGVPTVFGEVDGGLLDVVVHPDYANNGWIYFSYAAPLEGGNTTVVERARLSGTRLTDRQQLFEAIPRMNNGNHFGCRLLLSGGYLFIALGERNTRELAQNLSTHGGKILRLHDDGRVPSDNPFLAVEGALPELWTFGHRNPQGLALHPRTGEIWEHEHGPQGGDEVNLIRVGRNYGWPYITYGREYSGGPVGEGWTEHYGMEQPLHHYTPSIAPSGMEFYTGDAFPAWRDNLFIGALALHHLNRLVIENGVVTREERLLEDRNWRVRFVRQAPDGFLYLGVDGGMILRIRPD